MNYFDTTAIVSISEDLTMCYHKHSEQTSAANPLMKSCDHLTPCDTIAIVSLCRVFHMWLSQTVGKDVLMPLINFDDILPLSDTTTIVSLQ